MFNILYKQSVSRMQFNVLDINYNILAILFVKMFQTFIRHSIMLQIFTYNPWYTTNALDWHKNYDFNFKKLKQKVPFFQSIFEL